MGSLKILLPVSSRQNSSFERARVRKQFVHFHYIHASVLVVVSEISESLHARLLPRFRPVLMSLLDAQQQHMPIWISQASMAVPAAIHMSIRNMRSD